MNIGILGAGNIAGSMARTICGMAAQGRPVTLYAVASRSQEKAGAFAKAYGIPRAYGSYAAMLNDPLVELVYIATPHSHHAEQIRQCVAAGEEPVDTGEKHDSRNYQIIFHVNHNQLFLAFTCNHQPTYDTSQQQNADCLEGKQITEFITTQHRVSDLSLIHI